ncbi:hypothetical protein K502DRAFT_323544 [Neoconidiobolus thromboides FSU 785]|nr:hypothetical protein K502DRAFT_323544 [Neoconidiobolus thromboides FSU 785]
MFLNRARSLLHLKIEPEVYPLVAIVGVAATIGGYTVYKESRRYINNQQINKNILYSGGRHKEEVTAHVNPEKLDHLQGIIESESEHKSK